MSRRVLVLTPWYPTPDQPAWGVFVREHARAAALSSEVRVLHTVGPAGGVPGLWSLEREADPALTGGMETHRVRSRRLGLRWATYGAHVLAVVAAVLTLRRRGFRPDVLHAHGYDPGFAAVLAGRLLRVPVVISEHYSAFPMGGLDRRQLARARFAFARAERVLPVSRALEAGIRRHGLEGAFEVLPNVVDTALFHPPEASPPEEPYRFLFVGRMDPIKGVDTLLAAAATLGDAVRPWHLDLVGDGPYRARYEALADVPGLRGRVTFHGTLDKAEIALFMRRAHLLVLPSRWENAPCVVIEALASGLPVLASDVGGIPELIDEATGRLVPPETPEALGRELLRSLEDGARHDRAAIVARGRTFDLRVIGQRLDGIYRSVCEC